MHYCILSIHLFTAVSSSNTMMYVHSCQKYVLQAYYTYGYGRTTLTAPFFSQWRYIIRTRHICALPEIYTWQIKTPPIYTSSRKIMKIFPWADLIWVNCVRILTEWRRSCHPAGPLCGWGPVVDHKSWCHLPGHGRMNVAPEGTLMLSR